MKTYNITVLRGDGIGPEVIEQAIKAIKACADSFQFTINFSYQLIGAVSIDKYNIPLTDEAINDCLNSDAVLLGAIGDPKYDQDPNTKIRPEQGLLKLRKALSLFANIRPITLYPSLSEYSPLKSEITQGVDITIYRELTGGIYFGKKESSHNQASDLCTYTTEEITRIAELAFEAAMGREKRLCLVDKANVLETSRLWRSTVQNMAKQYPEVTVSYLYVDNAAMQLVISPSQFDVILTENMFGDILSDLASVIPGSLGLLPSSSIGKKTGLFEPCHGSYPQAAGQDRSNPMATILSAGMLLDYLGEKAAANQIKQAVNWCIEEQLTTEDINSNNPMGCALVGDMVQLFIEKEGDTSDINLKQINRETFLI